jgi:hypothetical protein
VRQRETRGTSVRRGDHGVDVRRSAAYAKECTVTRDKTTKTEAPDDELTPVADWRRFLALMVRREQAAASILSASGSLLAPKLWWSKANKRFEEFVPKLNRRVADGEVRSNLGSVFMFNVLATLGDEWRERAAEEFLNVNTEPFLLVGPRRTPSDSTFRASFEFANTLTSNYSCVVHLCTFGPHAAPTRKGRRRDNLGRDVTIAGLATWALREFQELPATEIARMLFDYGQSDPGRSESELNDIAADLRKRAERALAIDEIEKAAQRSIKFFETEDWPAALKSIRELS